MSSLVQGVWSFFKRHRRKVAVVGVLAGGLTFLNYYGRRKLREWQERETSEYLDRVKREQHFESTQKTCRATITSMIPALNAKISDLANCEAITEQLKSKPVNKLELWEKLKCASVARLVSEIYGWSLVTSLLNIQLNVIGGYMFLDALHLSSDSDILSPKPSTSATQPAHAPLHIQQRYLALIQQFLDSGCQNMYRFVLDAVNDCMGQVPLTEKVSLPKLQVMLNAIRANFEKAAKEADLNNLDLFGFVMSAELLNLTEKGAGSSSWDDMVYNRLINETRDLFESEDCKNAVSRGVDVAFSRAYDNLAGYFVSEGDEFKNPNEVTLPLAKAVPVLCAVTVQCFGEPNELLSRLFVDQKVLAANIYESFSQDNRVGDLRNHNTTFG